MGDPLLSDFSLKSKQCSSIYLMSSDQTMKPKGTLEDVYIIFDTQVVLVKKCIHEVYINATLWVGLYDKIGGIPWHKMMHQMAQTIWHRQCDDIMDF